MNNSRRDFLGKAPAVAIATGVGVASGKVAMASPPTPVEGTRELLEDVIAGQGKYNGFLYASGDLLLEVLRMVVPHISGIDLVVATAKLNQAEGYLDGVPSTDPPRCILPPDWPGY